MKITQRLDNARLAEALADRGLCEPQALREALQLSGRGNAPFAESIVAANLVTDWELGRVVAELYNLPFLPVEFCEPDSRALQGLDIAFLAEHGIVPLGRFGTVLTIVMPGMVSAEVVAALQIPGTELTVLPVVGTVSGNRRWIEMNLTPKLQATLSTVIDGAQEALANPEWGNLFDAADAAVNLELTPPEDGAELA